MLFVHKVMFFFFENIVFVNNCTGKFGIKFFNSFRDVRTTKVTKTYVRRRKIVFKIYLISTQTQ